MGYSGLYPYLLHCLGEDFLICLITHIGNETALLCAKEVSGAADVKVLHGNVEAAAKV